MDASLHEFILALVELLTQQYTSVVLHSEKYYRCHMDSRNSSNHYHQFLLLLVEHRASIKSFQELRSTAIPLTSFHDLLVLLISSSVVLHHVLFGLPLLLYPRGFQSNAVFSIAPVSLRNVFQSNSIFFFLSDFLLASDGWFSIDLRS